MAVIDGWRISTHVEPGNTEKNLAQRLVGENFRPVLDLIPSRQFEMVPELATSEGIPVPLPDGATELRLAPMSLLYLDRAPEQNVGFVLYVR